MAAATSVQTLVSLWQQHRAAGRDLPLDELCQGHPELVDELGRQIRLLQRMEALVQPAPADPDATGDQTAVNVLPDPGAQLSTRTPAGPPAGASEPEVRVPGYSLLGVLGRGGM